MGSPVIKRTVETGRVCSRPSKVIWSRLGVMETFTTTVESPSKDTLWRLGTLGSFEMVGHPTLVWERLCQSYNRHHPHAGKGLNEDETYGRDLGSPLSTKDVNDKNTRNRRTKWGAEKHTISRKSSIIKNYNLTGTSLMTTPETEDSPGTDYIVVGIIRLVNRGSLVLHLVGFY